MRIHRILRPESIRFSMETDHLPEPPEESAAEKKLWYWKEAILQEMVDVFEASGQIGSRRRLFNDLLNRERQATSGIGEGIAIPHVRTLQAKRFTIGFCRSERGLPFDAVDGEPVHIFIPMIAPPHDDTLYLRFYKQIAPVLLEEECRERLLAAETPDEVIFALQDHSPW